MSNSDFLATMLRTIVFSCLALVVFVLPVRAQSEYVAGEVVVKLTDATQLASVAAEYSLDPAALDQFGSRPIYRLRILDSATPVQKSLHLAATRQGVSFMQSLILSLRHRKALAFRGRAAFPGPGAIPTARVREIGSATVSACRRHTPFRVEQVLQSRYSIPVLTAPIRLLRANLSRDLILSILTTTRAKWALVRRTRFTAMAPT